VLALELGVRIRVRVRVHMLRVQNTWVRKGLGRKCLEAVRLQYPTDVGTIAWQVEEKLSRFLRTGLSLVSLTFVLLMFLFYFSFLVFIFFYFFSRATVSAVLQPCRTCYMFFLYVVLYVFLANK